MEVYTIGFSQKSAETFFGTLRQVGIKRLIDVRLNNISQLAGFAKAKDLPFFLRELCNAEYLYEPLFAPSQEILDSYKKGKGSWQTYEQQFLTLMEKRKIEERIPRSLFDVPSVLLCSEASADHCHRRLVLEYLQKKWGGIGIRHL
ncbi:MAG TPA: DUF488 domain-containing protein [Firmicutes bacterium]|nr:DUF488 domain-containing protein [Bacillota bacterium]